MRSSMFAKGGQSHWHTVVSAQGSASFAEAQVAWTARRGRGTSETSGGALRRLGRTSRRPWRRWQGLW
eukprot:14943390-Alexandrium_andersonii.AAC.1